MKKHHVHFLFVLACLLSIGKLSLAQFNVRAAIGRTAIAGSKAPAKSTKSHHNYTYQVTLKDGSLIQMLGRIQSAGTPNEFVLVGLQQKKEIRPRETLHLSRTDDQGRMITGTAIKGQWLFPVITGNIIGYSTYAENEPHYITHMHKAGTKALIAFNSRTHKERVQTATDLRKLIKGNEAAEKLLAKHERKARSKKIATYTALGGLGLTVGGLAAPFIPAFAIGLPAGFGGTLVAVSVRPVDLLKVIEVYNQPDNQKSPDKSLVMAE